MKVTEYTHNGNIVRIIEEEKTEEERAFQQKYLENAAATFLRKVLEVEAKAKKLAPTDSPTTI